MASAGLLALLLYHKFGRTIISSLKQEMFVSQSSNFSYVFTASSNSFTLCNSTKAICTNQHDCIDVQRDRAAIFFSA